jgi:ribonuclease J
LKQGGEVIYEAISDIHSSGHACREELKLLHRLVKPELFMPVHGEYRNLKRHSDLAVSVGMKPDDIFIMENGDVLEIGRDRARISGKVKSGHLLVDGLGVGDVGRIVLRDRKHLSRDGLIIAVVTVEKSTGEVIAGPDIVSRGFVYVKESENLMKRIRENVLDELSQYDLSSIDHNSMIKIIRRRLRDLLYRETKRNPMILPVIMEI